MSETPEAAPNKRTAIGLRVTTLYPDGALGPSRFDPNARVTIDYGADTERLRRLGLDQLRTMPEVATLMRLARDHRYTPDGDDLGEKLHDSTGLTLADASDLVAACAEAGLLHYPELVVDSALTHGTPTEAGLALLE